MNGAPALGTPRPVAFVVRSPFVSGAERWLVRSAAALDHTRYAPFVFLDPSDGVSAALAAAGLPYRELRLPLPQRAWPIPFAAAVLKLAATFRRRGVAIVQINDVTAALHASLAARWLRIPRVCHVHFAYDADGMRWWLKYGCEHVVVTSEFMRSYLESSCAELLGGAGCTVIRPGVDPPPPPEPAQLDRCRAALGLAAHHKVVAFVGQTIAIKGIDEFLDAARRLLDADKNCRFLIVGDDQQGGPNYREQMERRAAELGVATACRFTGFRDDVWTLLHLSDVVLVPSRIEPFGLVALEAGGTGRPVVAANVGGLPEIVVHGETGLLVPPNDAPALAAAAAALLFDRPRALAYGSRARERVRQRFSLRREADQLMALYDAAIARSAPGPRSSSSPPLLHATVRRGRASSR